MGVKHDKLAELAQGVKMSDDDLYEQRIDLAHGNLPEELHSSSKDEMRETDRVRSKGGLSGSTTFSPKTKKIATA